MIKVILKNNKTGELIETFYSVRDLVSHGGEDLLIENIIDNNVCHCNPIGETNVIECGCWEQWDDCSLIFDDELEDSILIQKGERVECTDKESSNYGKKGTFIGYLANGLEIKFDDGTTDLFLASSLKKI